MNFKKAERKRVKGRVAIEGPTGCGKTWTGLALAQALAKHFGGKVAVIDTERESASIYADRYDFDVLELDTFSVQNYMDAINAAADGGYGVLVIDSLSHAWAGKGGVLEAVDKAAKRMKNPNSYMAWREGTSLQDDLVETILRFPGHVIVTMRSKMDYVQEKNERTGKTEIRKVGLAPIQRDGLEYEFTVVMSMDIDHNGVITKSRCAELADQVYSKPGDNFFKPLIAWLDGGADVAVEQAEEEERKKLAVKVISGINIAEKQGIGGLDTKPHMKNWLRKWLGVEKIEDVNNCPADKLQAALDDLSEKAAKTYAEQAREIEKQLLVTAFNEEELADLRGNTLVTPIEGEATDDLDKASPHSIKTYVNRLKEELKKLEEAA